MHFRSENAVFKFLWHSKKQKNSEPENRNFKTFMIVDIKMPGSGFLWLTFDIEQQIEFCVLNIVNFFICKATTKPVGALFLREINEKQ